jgi:hypothetical protein
MNVFIKYLKSINIILHNKSSQLFILSIFAVVLGSWNMTSWKYAFVGDEWPFFEFALHLSKEQFFFFDIFNLEGVYGYHPYLSSIWQAMFINIFGETNFAWRFSNTILLAPLTYFFYYWVEYKFNKSIALTSTILFIGSSYLQNYFKIGYNNSISLVFFILILFLAERFNKYLDLRSIVLFALSSAFSIYVYIGALFPVMMLPNLMSTLYSEIKSKKQILYIIVSCIIFIIISIPFIYSFSNYYNNVSGATFSREFNNNEQIVINIARNFILAFINFDYFHNHFFIGPYISPLLWTFLIIGFIKSIINIKKRENLLLIIQYIFVCLILGLTNPYAYSPFTRGIFLTPFLYIFIGIGIEQIQKFLPNIYLKVLIIIVLIFNFYNSQIGFFKYTGFHPTSTILKELIYEANNIEHSNLILILDSDSHFNYHNINYLAKYYISNYNQNQLLTLNTSHENLCQIIENKKVLYLEYENTINEIKVKCFNDNYYLKVVKDYDFKKLPFYISPIPSP